MTKQSGQSFVLSVALVIALCALATRSNAQSDRVIGVAPPQQMKVENIQADIERFDSGRAFDMDTTRVLKMQQDLQMMKNEPAKYHQMQSTMRQEYTVQELRQQLRVEAREASLEAGMAMSSAMSSSHKGEDWSDAPESHYRSALDHLDRARDLNRKIRERDSESAVSISSRESGSSSSYSVATSDGTHHSIIVEHASEAKDQAENIVRQLRVYIIPQR